MNRLLLVDGNPYIFKAYFGGGDDPGLRSDGLPTGAVAGAIQRLWDLINSDDMRSQNFTHQAVIYDAPGKNFRHALSPAYKQNRTTQPDELLLQLKLAKSITPHLGLHAVQQRGYEADDLIATYARLADEEGWETVIVSSDKDLMSLVRPGTVIYSPPSQHGPGKWITETEVEAKFGVPPSFVPDAQALIGDPVDNIIGVPKVGALTAAKLIHQFGRLEDILANAENASTPVLRANLMTYADQARLARKLVALDDRVPVKIGLDDLEAYPVRGAALVASLKALEIVSFTKWIAWKFDVDVDRVAPCAQTLALAAEQLEWRKC